MMYRTYLYSLAVAILVIAVANGDTSLCTGYPKMYNGKPCASTTRYWDGNMGACGCGTGDTSPFSWQYTKPTAAASAPIFGAGGWCGSGCGKCFKLTPTGVGASVVGTGSPTVDSIVVKVTNLCPFAGNEQWCAYDVNTFGYEAHFDLMDQNMNGIISNMGWNNPEVTYEEVDCASNGYGDWKCQCASAVSSASPANTNTAASTTPVPISVPTSTTTTTKATSAPTTTKSAKTTTPAKTTATTTTKPVKVTATKPATTTTTKPAATTTTKSATTTTTKATVSVAPVQSSSGSSVQVKVKDGVNPWWFGFSVVGNTPFAKIEVMDSSTALQSWTQMSYQGGDDWGFYFVNSPQQMQAPLSLRFTSTAGKVLTATNIVSSLTPSVLIDTKLAL